MEQLNFTKLQALGNDFLIIAVASTQGVEQPGELARRMCRRRHGAGADGVVFISPARREDADFESRIFNADGGEAEVSGNGTRCAAAFLHYSGLWSKPLVRISTLAGVRRGRMESRTGFTFEFEFEMGRPLRSSTEVGAALAPLLDNLGSQGEGLRMTCLSMGNPHCSLFSESFDSPSIDQAGPLIEQDPHFPNGTNVELVRVISRDEIEVLFWERGVGRTLSSGTGSCAAAVSSALNGFTDRRVRVRTLGGELVVDWGIDDIVRLTGSAEVIYEGKWLPVEGSGL